MEPLRGPMASRTVLVTGASAGIGRATALGLASMGAHLARLVFETGDSVFTIDAPVVHNAVHHTSPHNPAGEKRCRRWCRGAG
jgi:NAD(P)-dependent dehydrogenase (short-subunit alcohol dehydrogenase family)